MPWIESLLNSLRQSRNGHSGKVSCRELLIVSMQQHQLHAHTEKQSNVYRKLDREWTKFVELDTPQNLENVTAVSIRAFTYEPTCLLSR
jgi:hypothetical protein